MEKREKEGWRAVATGCGLVSISGWIYLGSLGIFLLSILLLSLGLVSTTANAVKNPNPNDVAGNFFAVTGVFLIVVILLGLVMLAALILQLVGMGMCMAVPQVPRSNLRVLSIVAFALCCSGYTLYVLSSCFAAILGPVVIIFTLLGMGGFCVFMNFVSGAAKQLKNRSLASQAFYVFIGWCVKCGLLLLTVVLTFFVGFALLSQIGQIGQMRPAPKLVQSSAFFGYSLMGLSILITILHLGLVVWFSLICGQLKAYITRTLRKA